MSIGAELDTSHSLQTHVDVKLESLNNSMWNPKNAISPSEIWPFRSINPKKLIPKSVKSQCHSPHVWIVELLCLWVLISILDVIPSPSDNLIDSLVNSTVLQILILYYSLLTTQTGLHCPLWFLQDSQATYWVLLDLHRLAWLWCLWTLPHGKTIMQDG